MKHKTKETPKKPYSMSRAAQKEQEIMQAPMEQNAENSSTVPKEIKKREQNNVERVEEEVERIEEDMGE